MNKTVYKKKYIMWLVALVLIGGLSACSHHQRPIYKVIYFESPGSFDTPVNVPYSVMAKALAEYIDANHPKFDLVVSESVKGLSQVGWVRFFTNQNIRFHIQQKSEHSFVIGYTDVSDFIMTSKGLKVFSF